MKTRVINLDPVKYTGKNTADTSAAESAIREAATLLREGRLIAFPTETVYGLGADAYNEYALHNIYKVKNRPRNNPLISHILNDEQLESLASNFDGYAKILARRFWPGPLTMIFKKRAEIPDYMTAGLDTVAVRMPSHPVARALIRAAKTPIAAPSANLSGKPSPTNGAHVIHDLNGKIDMIIDSGPVPIGIESTVLDVTGAIAVILRPGGVTYSMIAEAIGYDNVIMSAESSNTVVCERISPGDGGERPRPNGERPRPNGERPRPNGERPRSPGISYRHYAPDAPMLLFKGDRLRIAFWMSLFLRLRGLEQEREIIAQTAYKYRDLPKCRDDLAKCRAGGESNVGPVAIIASDELLKLLGPDKLKNVKTISLGCSDKPENASRKFYNALRECDEAKAGMVYCELCGQYGIGAALAERMRRASDGNIIDTDDPLILFVCTGNTCRSAMAEALFNAEALFWVKTKTRTAELGGATASVPRAISAGLYAADGATAAPEAIESLKDFNVDLSGHRSQSLNYSLMMRSSLILTMTQAHADEVINRCSAVIGRVFTLVDFMMSFHRDKKANMPVDIDDPFGLGPEAYRVCAARLYDMIAPLVGKLTTQAQFDTDDGVYYTEGH